MRWNSACKKYSDLLLEGLRKGLIYVFGSFWLGISGDVAISGNSPVSALSLK